MRHIKYDEHCCKQLKEITALCYEISTKTISDVFFSYSPHTSEIHVLIYPCGWSFGAEDCIEIEVNGYKHIYFGDEEGAEPLENCLNQLKEILKEEEGTSCE